MNKRYYLTTRQMDSNQTISKRELNINELVFMLWSMDVENDDALFRACNDAARFGITNYDAKMVLKFFGVHYGENLEKLNSGCNLCIVNRDSRTIFIYSAE